MLTFFFQSLVPIETVRLLRSIEDVTLIHSCKSKVTPAQVFSFEFCEIFKNSFSTEYLQMAAFVHSYLFVILKHFPIKIWQLEAFVSNGIWSVYSNEKNFKIHFFTCQLHELPKLQHLFPRKICDFQGKISQPLQKSQHESFLINTKLYWYINLSLFIN